MRGIRLRNLSLKRKLVAIVMITTLAALSLSTSVFVVREVVDEHDSLRETLAGMAAIIGAKHRTSTHEHATTSH